jgi:hypothetical protein
VTFAQPGFFGEQSHSHQKRTQKRKLTIFGNTKQVIQDYDTVFDNSIPLRKNDLLRITYFRIPRAGPALCALAPRQRATPVTGAAADEYNLNVVDCNASVTVARRSSISVSGGLGGYPQPPEANRRKMVFRGLPRACWEFWPDYYRNPCICNRWPFQFCSWQRR